MVDPGTFELLRFGQGRLATSLLFFSAAGMAASYFI
jgi:hypothetical protein